MQSDYKRIYKLTSERTQIDEQVYKDIGNAVFSSLNSLFRRPPSLILKLRGIGSWHLRKKRMQIIHDIFPPNFERKEEDFTSEYGILKYENKKEIHQLFKDRLKDYDRYLSLRDSIRETRRKTQNLLIPEKD